MSEDRGRRAVLRDSLLSIPPFRSPAFKRRYLTMRRAQLRARRRREEARGSDRLSRPSLHGMDEKLLQHIGKGGFFVEAGAHDGFTQSNTYWLERFHGWQGILIEAVPELYEEARKERPNAEVINCALTADSAHGQTLTMRYAGTMSLVAGARGDSAADDEWVRFGVTNRWETAYDITVPARTITSVLEELDAPAPDLLSLDVEGYEPDVLRGLDFERYAPRFLLVEVLDDAARARVLDVLDEFYIVVDELSPYDVLFSRSDSLK